MSNETFADGIGRIAIIDGIVRLDLISYSPTETGPDGKPRQVFTHRIVMGMDQFLHASERIAKTAEMIRQQAGQPQAAPSVPVPSQAAPQPAPQQAAPRPPQVAPEHRRENIKPLQPAAETPATPPPPQRPFP